MNLRHVAGHDLELGAQLTQQFHPSRRRRRENQRGKVLQYCSHVAKIPSKRTGVESGNGADYSTTLVGPKQWILRSDADARISGGRSFSTARMSPKYPANEPESRAGMVPITPLHWSDRSNGSSDRTQTRESAGEGPSVLLACRQNTQQTNRSREREWCRLLHYTGRTEAMDPPIGRRRENQRGKVLQYCSHVAKIPSKRTGVESGNGADYSTTLVGPKQWIL